MPKISLPLIDNFITYYNLKNAPEKMTKLINEFEFTSFERYMRYRLDKIPQKVCFILLNTARPQPLEF